MIYLQKTWAVINDEKYRYRISYGILKEDIYNEKKYIWSDEKLENFQCKLKIDCFLKRVREGQFEYFEIRKKLFSGREYLVFNSFHTYEIWYLDEIERVDVKYYYSEQSMVLDKARERLDVEEYTKMIKSLGLESYK